VGVAQLEQLDGFVEIKRRNGRRYLEKLAHLDHAQLPLESTPYAENIYWVFGLVLSDDLPFDNQHAMSELGDRKIGTRPFFWPMHEQPVLKRLGIGNRAEFPVAERLARRGFYLPSGLALEPGDIDTVAEAVTEILN
jgi:perosamine synthetase